MAVHFPFFYNHRCKTDDMERVKQMALLEVRNVKKSIYDQIWRQPGRGAAKR